MSAWSRVVRRVAPERERSRLERESLEAVIGPTGVMAILGERGGAGWASGRRSCYGVNRPLRRLTVLNIVRLG